MNRSRYIQTITRLANDHRVPVALVDAVVRIESAYDPAAVGGVGEIGLMQVRPTTAAMMGFRGTLAELADPETNLRYGVTYLAQAWRLASGDLCRTLMKYRAGHGEEWMSPLSHTYCLRAQRHLASISSLRQVERADVDFSVAESLIGHAARQRVAGRARSGQPARNGLSAHPIALSQGGYRLVGHAAAPAGYLRRPMQRRSVAGL